MAKVYTYIDEGRGPSLPEFLEAKFGETALNGQTPLYIAEGPDEVSFFVSAEPFDPAKVISRY